MVTAIVVVLGIGAVLGLMVLTMVGGHRRGERRIVAVLRGLIFPVAWIAWYVEDEQPHLFRRHRRA
jgi:hypothetical protein